MMAVCDNKLPFSTIKPAADTIRKIQPGSVVSAISTFPRTSPASAGLCTRTASAVTRPAEQPVPCSVSLALLDGVRTLGGTTLARTVPWVRIRSDGAND